MSVLFVQPSTMMRDWDDVIKAPGRFDGFTYGDDSLEFFDLTHRVEWASVAAAAGAGAMLDPLHRYLMVKNMGTDPVLLHLNTQANGPNPAFEVTVLPGCFVEYVDLWMSVQPSIRVDSALYSSPIECEVLQIGEYKEIEEEPEEFCDLWAVGHVPAAGALTKHNPELPGPWELVANPIGATADHWLADVAGVTTDDYWAVGYTTEQDLPLAGILMFWNDIVWVEDAGGGEGPPFFGVWGFAQDNYWAVGGDTNGPAEIWQWTGAAWAQDCIPDPENDDVFYCVHGDVPTLVYAGGKDGLMASWTLGVWTVHPPFAEFPDTNIYGTWTSQTQRTYICGGSLEWWADSGGVGQIYTEGPPMAWQTYTLPVGTPTLRAIWGFNDADIWAVGDNGTILHMTDGVHWLEVTEPLGDDWDYRGIFGCHPWSIWACATSYAGEHRICYWDGVAWTIQEVSAFAEGDLLGIKGVWVPTP